MVYLGIAHTTMSRIGSVILIIVGLFSLLLAIFHVDVNPYLTTTPYILHKVAAAASGVLFPIGAFLLSRDEIEEGWRGLSKITAGVAAIVFLLELGETSAFYAPNLIGPWFGLYERILLSIPLVWMMLVSVTFLRISR